MTLIPIPQRLWILSDGPLLTKRRFATSSSGDRPIRSACAWLLADSRRVSRQLPLRQRSTGRQPIEPGAAGRLVTRLPAAESGR